MRAPAVIAVAAAGLALGAPAAAAHPQRYYLALGDSLAVGVQPDGPPPYNETSSGYPDQLLGLLRSREPGLVLVKLGCGGESTRSMIEGSLLPPAPSCGPPDYYAARYAQKTQLATAVQFLRTHRDQVTLVTLDIGSNDLEACIPTADAACIQAGLRDLAPRLTTILHALRHAGATRIVGMTYYDAFLGAWLAGPDGEAFARATNDNVLSADATLTRVYRAAGARVADVAGAFHIADFTPTTGGLPLNVTLTCRWTWFCAPPPLGPDVHPTTEGYGVIARAIAARVRGS